MVSDCEHVLIGSFDGDGWALCQECNKEVSYTDVHVALLSRISAHETENERLKAENDNISNDYNGLMAEHYARGNRIVALEAELAKARDAMSLLDGKYEAGRNPDCEDDNTKAIYRVSGARSDREWQLVATAKTTEQALYKVLDGKLSPES